MRILLLLALAGCGKHEAEGGQLEAKVSGVPAKPAPAPGAVAPQALAKTHRACWDAWNAATWVELRHCFAVGAVLDLPGRSAEVKGDAIIDAFKALRTSFRDAAGKPELVLISDKRLIAVVHVTGKQDGAWTIDGSEIAPTHHQVSVYIGEVLEFDDQGKIVRASEYLDLATVRGQVKPQKGHDVRGALDQPFMVEKVAITADDARERANLGTIRQLVARLGKHDATALGALLADDLHWSEQALPADRDRKGALARVSELSKQLTDSRVTLDGSMAAGDYVAAFETIEGTQAKRKVSLPVLAIHELAGGKAAAVWLFYQSTKP